MEDQRSLRFSYLIETRVHEFRIDVELGCQLLLHLIDQVLVGQQVRHAVQIIVRIVG